mmetsp:Transcript_48016/g.112116  ORF Transcript_48016/g.112116 Transcript_48016/m.112116 type:complete len:290 (+) Transcript_48016:105-974(+)
MDRRGHDAPSGGGARGGASLTNGAALELLVRCCAAGGRGRPMRSKPGTKVGADESQKSEGRGVISPLCISTGSVFSPKGLGSCGFRCDGAKEKSSKAGELCVGAARMEAAAAETSRLLWSRRVVSFLELPGESKDKLLTTACPGFGSLIGGPVFPACCADAPDVGAWAAAQMESRASGNTSSGGTSLADVGVATGLLCTGGGAGGLCERPTAVRSKGAKMVEECCSERPCDSFAAGCAALGRSESAWRLALLLRRARRSSRSNSRRSPGVMASLRQKSASSFSLRFLPC